jgi:hypothetical protein
MRRFVSAALLLCLFAQFGGCASSTMSDAAAEPQPQSRPRDSRLARLYFLREKGLIASEVGIKIDGKQVGSIDKGLYFWVDRSPGHYRLTCVNRFGADYETEIQIEGGRSYYFGVGVAQLGFSPGQNVVNQVVAGSSGQQMQTTSALSAGFSGSVFYQIDAAEGPTVVSQLKPR